MHTDSRLAIVCVTTYICHLAMLLAKISEFLGTFFIVPTSLVVFGRKLFKSYDIITVVVKNKRMKLKRMIHDDSSMVYSYRERESEKETGRTFHSGHITLVLKKFIIICSVDKFLCAKHVVCRFTIYKTFANPSFVLTTETCV